MSTLLINMAGANSCFITTVIIEGLTKTGEENIDCLVKDKNSSRAFQFNPNVSDVYIGSLPNTKQYNTAIYLSDSTPDRVGANMKMGFGYNKKSILYYDILFGNKYTKKNVFKVYFNLAELIWKGERPNCHYYPKTKEQTHKTGLAISHMNLSHYVSDKLNLEESKLWRIPYRSNILKKMDEINYCSRIVTDDYVTMQLAISLGKYVFFLKTLPYNTKIETFGNGTVLNVPISLIR